MPTKRRDKDIASHNKAIKRNPSFRHPWASNPEDNGFVWIHINARKILDQYSKGQGQIRVKTGAPEVQYAFLAPLALTENIVHNWAEYDSIASRLAQKIRSAAKIGAEFQGLVNAFESSANLKSTVTNILKNRSSLAGGALESLVRQGYDAISPHSIPKIKTDTPLYYENSQRRNLTFEVMLLAENDPRNDVVEPIKDLMKYSSPNLIGQGGVDIEFPYMFEVYTRPKEFLRYSTLALTAVQPTYNQPYIGGYPSHAIVQFTFTDMSPLYRGAIESGSVIRVIKSGETASRAARGVFPTTGEEARRRQDERRGTGKGTSGDPENYDDKPVVYQIQGGDFGLGF